LEDLGGDVDVDGDRVAHPVAGNPSDSPTELRRTRTASIISAESPATPKSWEDLDIVNFKTLMDLRSGVSFSQVAVIAIKIVADI